MLRETINENWGRGKGMNNRKRKKLKGSDEMEQDTSEKKR